MPFVISPFSIQTAPQIRNVGVETPDVEVEEIVEEEVKEQLPWRVILFNDDIHTFDDVIHQLLKAVDCTREWAEKKAWEVHTRGKANVYEGEFEACFRVQMVLQEVQLVVEIQG